MRLEVENGPTIENPRGADIEESLRKLADSDGGFAILSRSMQNYIQAAGNRRDGFTLEYQEGDTDVHFVAARTNIPLDEVARAFRQYAENDPDWKKGFEWKSMEVTGKSGCAANVLLIAAVGIGLLTAGIVLAASVSP